MEKLRLHQEIFNNIERAQKILIVIHQNPDGDAIGSGLALANFLGQKGKEYTLFALDKPSHQYAFLPEVESLSTDQGIFSYERFDLIFVLDSGDLEYAGVDQLIKVMPQGRPLIINIDHHHTNQLFGDLNLVNPLASSTAEVLYRFFDGLRIPINKEMATCLLTGILTDTGTFSNPATTIDSLLSASQLLINGANLKKIIQNRKIFFTKRVEFQ